MDDDDLDRILNGDPLAPDWGRTPPQHIDAVTRKHWHPMTVGLAYKLRLWPLYRWLTAGTTGACSCGWRCHAATSAQADSKLAEHVMDRSSP